MDRLQDRIVGGSICGILANQAKTAIENLAFRAGFAKTTGAQVSAGFFLPATQVTTPKGRIIGLVSDNLIAAGLGVLGTYLLSYSGRDKAVLKGMGIGFTSWTLAYGILGRLGVSSRRKPNANTVITSLVSHTVFGMVKMLAQYYLMEPSLFRPRYKTIGMPKGGAIRETSRIPAAIDRDHSDYRKKVRARHSQTF